MAIKAYIFLMVYQKKNEHPFKFGRSFFDFVLFSAFILRYSPCSVLTTSSSKRFCNDFVNGPTVNL